MRLVFELRILTSHCTDLMRDRTRSIKGLRSLLSSYFPAWRAGTGYQQHQSRTDSAIRLPHTRGAMARRAVPVGVLATKAQDLQRDKGSSPRAAGSACAACSANVARAKAIPRLFLRWPGADQTCCGRCCVMTPPINQDLSPGRRREPNTEAPPEDSTLAAKSAGSVSAGSSGDRRHRTQWPSPRRPESRSKRSRLAPSRPMISTLLPRLAYLRWIESRVATVEASQMSAPVRSMTTFCGSST